MESLVGLSRGIDRFNEAVGKISAWAILVAILVSAINAIVRKALGVSSNAWLELQWYLFGVTFMFCAPWTLAMNEHIRIDIVSSKLRPVTRNIIEMMGHLLFLLPFAALMTYLSWPFFYGSYLSGEMSSSAGGLIIWPAKLLILIGFALLLLQWLSEVIKRVAVMRGAIPDPYFASEKSAAELEAERLLALADDAGPNPPSVKH